MADLLIEWEDLYRQGQDTPASVLCKDHPELAETLTRQIAALKRVAWLDKKLEVDGVDPGDDPPNDARPQKLLADRYRLDQLIATGGFAEVWRAFDQELQRIIAVKIPKRTVVGSSASSLAEARRVARLKHPGILPVYDVGLDGDDCFFVSEYIEGGSLADHLTRGKIPADQACQWIRSIADALDHAHRSGVIHRDVKPANILIDDHSRALLVDFGIAQSSAKTRSITPSLGTLRYMAPEQLAGQEVVPQSDIYSLAVVLHECLAGKPPYSSAEPNTLRREIGSGAEVSRDVPKSLAPILRKALNKDPGQRYATAAEFATALSARQAASWKVLLIAGVAAISLVALMLARGRDSSPSPTPQQESVADESGVPPHDRRIWNAVTDHPGKQFLYDPRHHRWAETTDDGKRFAYFFPVAITDDYIHILDRSRNLGVRLYADRCDYSCTNDFVNDYTTLCTGRWCGSNWSSSSPALNKPITIHAARDTLENYLLQVSQNTGIAISLDTEELQQQGITKNQSFGLDVTDQPAQGVLSLILSMADPEGRLRAVPKTTANGGSAIEITTKQALDTHN